MNVGVIGAGRMGLPIIGHLARKGFQTLVHDIDGATQPAGRAVSRSRARTSSVAASAASAPTSQTIVLGLGAGIFDI